VTHKEFKAYIDLCRSRGLSDYQAAAMLGCGVNSIVRWKTYDPPRYIGLAIAALETELEPWTRP
jgi:hypothetical protein